MELGADIIYADGQENMGGIKSAAYIGFVAEFTTIAKPITNPVTYSDRVTIPTAHVLATGKKVIKLYAMYDKSGIESAMAGAMRKGKSFKPKLTLFYPGTDAEVIGLLGLIKNADMLVFAELQDSSGMVQIGTADLPASIIAASVKTGTAPDGERGVSFDVEAASHEAFYFYTAALPRLGA